MCSWWPNNPFIFLYWKRALYSTYTLPARVQNLIYCTVQNHKMYKLYNLANCLWLKSTKCCYAGHISVHFFKVRASTFINTLFLQYNSVICRPSDLLAPADHVKRAVYVMKMTKTCYSFH